MRAFVAIDLTTTVRRRLADLEAELSKDVPRGTVRWVAADGIHLTLKFLGETSQEQAGGVQARMESLAADFAPFEVQIGGAGCFPSLNAPRVVWIGAASTDGELGRLQTSLESECSKLGFEREQRGFRPHLTLGRVNRAATHQGVLALRAAVEQLGPAGVGAMRVDRIHLFRSELLPSGPVYTTLASSPFSGAMR